MLSFSVILSNMGSSFPTTSYLHEIGDATAELLLQLQLTDLHDLRDDRPGKQREGITDDGGVAASLLEESLEDVRAQLADRRMTKSIAEAVQADGAILTRNALGEETAGDDHALAHRLNGSNVTSDLGKELEPVDDTVLSILAGRFVYVVALHALHLLGGDAIENDVATCSICYTETCTICKSQAHIGAECPNHTALQAVIDLGNENNWQRCYSCRRMVELEIGCNHMTYEISPVALSAWLTFIVAVEPHNSATSVVSGGRHVPAISGTRIGLSPVRPRSSGVRNHALLPTIQFAWKWFRKQAFSCENATIVLIATGDM